MLKVHAKPLANRLLTTLGACAAALTVTACTTAQGDAPALSPASPAVPQELDLSAYEALDPLFANPVIDQLEWRDQPLGHYYVHGGFADNETRFSFYLPAQEEYEGRFFQYITPVPISENLTQEQPDGPRNHIGFSIASGAYFVETNGGGTINLGQADGIVDSNYSAFGANAAAAHFSRTVAQALYGTDERPFGYSFGGSGGAYRTIGGMESTSGIWDGAVPFVPGSDMAIPNMFTVRIQAMRMLGDRLAQVTDAVEPGGSGDIYAGLDEDQARALREATLMGFPTPAWFGYRTMGIHGFAALYQGILGVDPSYFTQFWNTPGYLGHDRPDLFANARMQHDTAVAAPITAAEAAGMGVYLNDSGATVRGNVDTAFADAAGEEADNIVGYRLNVAPPDLPFFGGDLFIESGTAAGRRINVAEVEGDIIWLGLIDQAIARQIALGDAVRVDNSNFLAMESYHRHQVPLGDDFPVWDQFRNAEGDPIYPQRPMLIGPIFTRSTSGSGMSGQFDGKMIVLASLWDREAMPWQADWYRNRVRGHLGDTTDQHLRLYYTDHALHGDNGNVEDANRVVSYIGMLQQSLRDLSAWVENDIVPPRSTQYQIDNGAVIVPDTAAERQGLQPVVALSVNGGERADVAVGEEVTLTGVIEAPAGGGEIVSLEWDFNGDGIFTGQLTSQLSDQSHAVTGTDRTEVSRTHSYNQPGTYFVALRAVTQREDALGTPYARLINLGRVRVVVE